LGLAWACACARMKHIERRRRAAGVATIIAEAHANFSSYLRVRRILWQMLHRSESRDRASERPAEATKQLVVMPGNGWIN
jgi:hypothetical protein